MHSFIPETKGRSLEEMDIIFGSITAEQRRAHIEEFERGEWTCVVLRHLPFTLYLRPCPAEHGKLDQSADSISKV